MRKNSKAKMILSFLFTLTVTVLWTEQMPVPSAAATATGTYDVMIANRTGTAVVPVVAPGGATITAERGVPGNSAIDPSTGPSTQQIICPTGITVPNDPNQCGAVVNYPPHPTTGVTCSPASGSFFTTGVTTVTCSTSAGSMCSFTITVIDTQPPTITCPASISVGTAGTSAVVNYPAPTVTDNCPGVGAPVCLPASGSSFQSGVTTVNCSVKDASNNTATCGFTINVTVVAPPTIAKAFGAATIPLSGSTSLTFTINNPNPTASLGSIAFTDNLPSGLVVATPNGLSGVCGGSVTAVAGSGSISLTGGTIAAGGSCVIAVNVTGATAGVKNNTTGTISSTEGGTGATSNTATITVVAPPTISKAFGAANIPVNGTTSLTFTINNPNTTEGLTGIAFIDNLPAGLVVATPNGLSGVCGGSVTAVPGSSSISLSGGTLAASGSCMIAVNVTGTTSGVKNNTTDPITSANGGTGATSNTATLIVAKPPTITKAFGATDIALNQTTSLTLTINNSNTIALMGVAVSDTLPAGLVVATPNGLSNSCAGTVTAIPGTDLISLAGGIIAPGSSCTLSVNVKGTTAGPKNNTTDAVSSTESGPGTTSNTATVTVHPISIGIADPAVCLGPGGVVGVTATVTNAALSPQDISFTATLPPGLVGIPGTCASTVGTCTVVNASTVTLSETLAAGQTVTITYKAQVGDVLAGTLCINSVVTFDGGTPVTVEACTTVNCPPVGPGAIFPQASEANDQKAGSILIYNAYTSSASIPAIQNTRISMTNVHTSLSTFVHLFFVDGSTCSIADFTICLTPSQTHSFLASEFDPGTTGYVVAVAVNATGCPVSFNYLIGEEFVKFSSGHAANLGAEAISALPGGLPACDVSSQTALLSFDNVSYNALPRVLAADGIPDRATGNNTLLVLNRIGGNLQEGASTIGPIFGILFNDQEQSHSFGFISPNCQFMSTLSNSLPRTAPRFETVITGGRTGWLKLWGTDDIAILGAKINFNPNAASSADEFNQGRNLHKLRLTTAAQLIIPIFPPRC